MNVEAIGEIYTGLLRETSQDLERQFQNCRAYDVTFANTDVTIGNDPTAATVTVRPHTPVTEEPARAASLQSSEVFTLVRSARVVYRGKGFARQRHAAALTTTAHHPNVTTGDAVVILFPAPSVPVKNA